MKKHVSTPLTDKVEVIQKSLSDEERDSALSEAARLAEVFKHIKPEPYRVTCEPLRAPVSVNQMPSRWTVHSVL